MPASNVRVLHIGKFFPPHAGGIERFSADLCTTLAARGIDVAMLAHASPGDGKARHILTSGVNVHLAACHGQWLYAPLSPSFPFLLARLIREFKPDLLHLHVPNTSAFWALLIPAARRLPWLVQWHSDVPLDIRRPAVRTMYRLYRPFEQALLRRAGAIAATSAPYRDTSPALGAWLGKTHVVPLGIDESRHADSSSQEKTQAALEDTFSGSIQWPGNGLRLLAVGRLSYYKGFDVLLRALAQTSEVSLLLVGSGECRTDLLALARALHIEDRVCFAGQIDDTQLALAYSQAQVFCLPSIERTEAFGIVLLEAMRARLPTIATSIAGSGVGYVVADGISGMLVAPGDAQALALAIRRLAADAAVRARYGEAGHARWQADFTLDQCADRVSDLYRSLLPESEHLATSTPVPSPMQVRVEERDG
jgi:glycosyltransferase involved in cell wall biosynthesis